MPVLDNVLAQGAGVPGHFGHEDVLGTAREPYREGQEPVLAAHDLDDKYPLVARRGIAYLVYGLDGSVQRRVKTYGFIGPKYIVINGGGNIYHRNTVF